MKTRSLSTLYKLLLIEMSKKENIPYGICGRIHEIPDISREEQIILSEDLKSRCPRFGSKGKRFANFAKHESFDKDLNTIAYDLSLWYWWETTDGEGYNQRILFLEAVIKYLTKSK